MGHGEPGEGVLQSLRVLVHDGGGVAQLGGQRGVDHVGAGQPEVEEAAGVARGLLHRADEGGEVVALLGLELGHPGHVDVGGGSEDGGGAGGDPSRPLPSLHGDQLHLQPPPEPGLLAEDLGDARWGVAGDHVSRLYGGQPEPRRGQACGSPAGSDISASIIPVSSRRRRTTSGTPSLRSSWT